LDRVRQKEVQDGSSGDSTWTAGRPVLGVFVARILLGVKLRADSKRDVEALAALNLQLLFAL
jgi:hypothetical protein